MFMGIMLSWILVNTMALGICLTHCQLLDLLIVVKLMWPGAGQSIVQFAPLKIKDWSCHNIFSIPVADDCINTL